MEADARRVGWVTCCVFALLSVTTIGQEYEITRATIDGGGVIHSAGGGFELSGTVGQPDAATTNDATFAVTGGLWFGLAPADCNDDGLVSLADHEVLTACLTGPQGGISASPCPCFDADGDGDITLFDFAKLQAGFTGQ